ncbi:MAG: twin-arginine translocase TatA/TatE family subunit [Fimbriimonadaceae bacterium]|jgi:sec-independent protein translocase protein TatA|nr:twin-arginine translocase TatA/TatE family subunit [Fimbriimonadaceae bacterium]
MLNALFAPLAFLQGQEILVIAIVILMLFGGAKIPQLMRGVGQGLGEFQKGLREAKTAAKDAAEEADQK